MSWKASKRDVVAPKDLYELAAAHKLVPRDMATAVQTYRSMAGMVDWWTITDSDGRHVADMLITPMPSGLATLDLVPEPEFFAPSRDFEGTLVEAALPVIEAVYGGPHQIRKIEAEVPVSRSRTKKALVALGFRHEGKRAVGIQFYGKEPEDTFIMGRVATAAAEV